MRFPAGSRPLLPLVALLLAVGCTEKTPSGGTGGTGGGGGGSDGGGGGGGGTDAGASDSGPGDAGPSGPAHSRLVLTVLHNNDGESQLLNAGAGLESFGGIARFKTVVDQLRAQARTGTIADADHDVLVVSSGDNVLPGPELSASLAPGAPFYDAIAIRALRYDALALGNHDFDHGPDVLARLIESVVDPVPFVSANLDFSPEPRLAALVQAGRLAPRTVVRLSTGHRIGIIGLTTPTLPTISTPRNVAVSEDLLGAVSTQVAALEAEGVDKILLMSHLQEIRRDLNLVGMLRGVDAVISGGGDELLANAGDLLIPGDEGTVAGPYPVAVTDADGQAVPVVTTTGNFRYVGRLVLEFDGGRVVRAGGGLVRVAAIGEPGGVADDPDVQRDVVVPLAAAVAGLQARVVARSEVPLDGTRASVRGGNCNLGDLVADSLVWEAARVASQYQLPAATVGLVNGGGLRNDSIIPAGELTEFDTFKIAPFPNFVSVFPDLAPAKLLEVLEHGVGELGGGGWLHVSGLTVLFDPMRQTERVRRVALADGTVVVEGGAVVAGAPSVTVATISFLATGGSGTPFEGARFVNLAGSYQGALAAFVSEPSGLAGTIPSARYPEGGNGRLAVGQ